MRKAWLKFWFNDYVRILGVVLGGHLIVTAPYLYGLLSLLSASFPSLGITNVSLPNICFFSYFVIFWWALIDNDYSKLEGL